MGPFRTVLLVEDDPNLRELIGVVLTQVGFEVTATGDGREAIEQLGGEQFDLAVVEMMLPGASGFQVNRVVKERSDWHVPVIMISGNASAAHRDYAIASGADAFLAKPFHLHTLAKAARGLCPPTRIGAARELARSAGAGR